MPKAFDFSSPPFDRLRPMEVERINHVVDVVFFRTGRFWVHYSDAEEH